MEARMDEREHVEEGPPVGGGNNTITLSPNTGVSVALMVTVIGAAVWIVSGQQRLEARSSRLEELVLDLKTAVAATASDNDRTGDELQQHEAWSRAEAIRLRMAMNETRGKLGLPQLQETLPYSESSNEHRR